MEAELPKDFDGRAFVSCKSDGQWDKAKVLAVCNQKGFKDKADAVVAYLIHKDDKPAAKGKKKSAYRQEIEAVPENLLFAKRSYKSLSPLKIGKLIEMLTAIQNEVKQAEIEEVKARIERDQKHLKELQGK